MKNILYAFLFLTVIYGCSGDDNNSQVNPEQTQGKMYITAWFVSNQSGPFNPLNHIGIYRNGNRINMRNQNNGNESIPRAEVNSGDNIVIRYDIGLEVGPTVTMKYAVQLGNTELTNGENSVTNSNPMASGHEFFNIIIP